MSNPPLSFTRATAVAQILTGKSSVQVLRGNPGDGPHTDLTRIVLGSSCEFDDIDRLGILIHECSHICFPAKYPDGNLRSHANLIDDCRIERQFSLQRPHYENALAVTATNVIANAKYAEKDPKTGKYPDPWSKDFDPQFWALLYFRSHLEPEVREAALTALKGYIQREKLDKDPNFKARFEQLVRDGFAITRLKSVSQATLQKWCEHFFVTFPKAQRDQSGGMSFIVLKDNPSSKDAKDAEGAGDAQGDESDVKAAMGKGRPGQNRSDGKPSMPGDAPEADTPKDLQGEIDKLKERIKKVGTEAQRAAEEQYESEINSGRKDTEEAPDGSGGPTEEDYSRIQGGGPGRGDPRLKATNTKQTVDKNFVVRVKMGIRKIQTMAEGKIDQHRRSGRLDMRRVIAADRLGIVPSKPFIRTVDDIVNRPVACAVATDFSGSTEGAMNDRLNRATHNMTYALQAAGCETAEVIWNSGATITKTLDQEVSPLAYKRHSSGGGTELMAACLGSIKALKESKAKRKIVFIFTDGQVNQSEVAPIEAEFRKQGVEGVLLVSLDSQVNRKGIVETATIKDIGQLGPVFDRFVKRQAAKALGL